MMPPLLSPNEIGLLNEIFVIPAAYEMPSTSGLLFLSSAVACSRFWSSSSADRWLSLEFAAVALGTFSPTSSRIWFLALSRKLGSSEPEEGGCRISSASAVVDAISNRRLKAELPLALAFSDSSTTESG